VLLVLVFLAQIGVASIDKYFRLRYHFECGEDLLMTDVTAEESLDREAIKEKLQVVAEAQRNFWGCTVEIGTSIGSRCRA
jgi:hypothetical protein